MFLIISGKSKEDEGAHPKISVRPIYWVSDAVISSIE